IGVAERLSEDAVFRNPLIGREPEAADRATGKVLDLELELEIVRAFVLRDARESNRAHGGGRAGPPQLRPSAGFLLNARPGGVVDEDAIADLSVGGRDLEAQVLGAQRQRELRLQLLPGRWIRVEARRELDRADRFVERTSVTVQKTAGTQSQPDTPAGSCTG